MQKNQQVIATILICRLFDMADSARVVEAVARLLEAVARLQYTRYPCHDARALEAVARALEEVARALEAGCCQSSRPISQS